MKTLFTLMMPVLMFLTAAATNHLFVQGAYLASAFFTIVCFLATSVWITLISSRKIVLR